jgi:hypothetical protein
MYLALNNTDEKKREEILTTLFNSIERDGSYDKNRIEEWRNIFGIKSSKK